MLNDTQCRTAKPQDKAYKLSDSHGLHLEVKPNGVKVADNWADLTDGSLDAAINVTETAAAPPAGNPTCGSNSVWSNTRADGTLYNSINSCANWNSTASAGHWGQSSLVNGGWTSACAGGTCSWQEPMYCFQQ